MTPRDDRTEWRIEELENWRRIREGAGLPEALAKQSQRLDDLEDWVEKLDERLQSNTRALIGLALSVSGSAVVFALSVLVATGKL